MNNEIWCDVKGYEDLYQISNYGRLKSLTKNIIMKQQCDYHGYQRMGLFKDKKYKKFFVHTLVAKHFISNPNHLPQVNHIDGNSSNNYAYNLEWCTPKENTLHAWKTGLAKAYNRNNPILQYDLQGNFLKEWDSINSVCISLFHNVDFHSNIVRCCQNRCKKAYGFIWRYKNV